MCTAERIKTVYCLPQSEMDKAGLITVPCLHTRFCNVHPSVYISVEVISYLENTYGPEYEQVLNKRRTQGTEFNKAVVNIYFEKEKQFRKVLAVELIKNIGFSAEKAIKTAKKCFFNYRHSIYPIEIEYASDIKQFVETRKKRQAHKQHHYAILQKCLGRMYTAKEKQEFNSRVTGCLDLPYESQKSHCLHDQITAIASRIWRINFLVAAYNQELATQTQGAFTIDTLPHICQLQSKSFIEEMCQQFFTMNAESYKSQESLAHHMIAIQVKKIVSGIDREKQIVESLSDWDIQVENLGIEQKVRNFVTGDDSLTVAQATANTVKSYRQKTKVQKDDGTFETREFVPIHEHFSSMDQSKQKAFVKKMTDRLLDQSSPSIVKPHTKNRIFKELYNKIDFKIRAKYLKKYMKSETSSYKSE